MSIPLPCQLRLLTFLKGKRPTTLPKHCTLNEIFGSGVGRQGNPVNSISPGYIRTAITAGSNPEYQKLWIESIPMKRMGTPEELAVAVIYLLSDASTYTSGADLIIDGCFDDRVDFADLQFGGFAEG